MLEINSQQTSLIISTKQFSISKDISKELVRKSLHLLIACTPSIVGIIGQSNTIGLLALGVLFYSFAEYFRMTDRKIFIISRLTEIAMRERDKNHFVLGPVTLGIGAMMALCLYPNPAATIAIYALAFGDGLSSLVGKTLGTVKIPFTGGKSIEGSLTCFIAVLLSIVFLVPHISINSAIIISLAATVLEVLPSKDYDNLILPVGTGLIAVLVG